MKNFTPISNQNFTFGDCKNCQALCCKSVYSQIIKDEFESIYKDFPILFIFGTLGFVKPVVILSNGFDFCPYLKDFRCTIYEKRPIVCKTYPLSPNLDNQIYIDSFGCPEINKGEKKLEFEKEYFASYFKSYQEKYIETHFEFEKLEKNDFEFVCTILGVDFYKYVGVETSSYLEFHRLSLENLERFII